MFPFWILKKQIVAIAILTTTTMHTLMQFVARDSFIFAPDERGYLYTFENLYGQTADPNPQYGSGWITAPKAFLQVIYLPGRILNVVGVESLVALRLNSLFLSLVTLYLTFLILGQKTGNKTDYHFIIFCAIFALSSNLLWLSLGLRESVMALAIALLILGLKIVSMERKKSGYVICILGSYFLLSSKPYQWIVCVFALMIAGFILLMRYERRQFTSIICFVVVLPGLLYSITAGSYAINFIKSLKVDKTIERSGDSITYIYNDKNPDGRPIQGNSTLLEIGDALGLVETSPPLPAVSNLPERSEDVIIKNLTEVPVIGDWAKSALEKEINKALEESSTGDSKTNLGNIIEPASLFNFPDLVLKSVLFAVGPIPFAKDYGFFVNILAVESLIWLSLFLYLLVQLVRLISRKVDWTPEGRLFLVSFLFFLVLGQVLVGALTEVNLGTSIRHRTLLMIPMMSLLALISETIPREDRGL